MKHERVDIQGKLPKPARIPVIGICAKCRKRVSDYTRGICLTGYQLSGRKTRQVS